MSNIPKNENLNEVETVLEEDGFSTVFSDPTVHNKTADNRKKKKRLPVAIASLLAVAVLVGGTVAVIKLIPEKEEDTSSTPVIEDITVLENDADDFKTVTVTNKNGTFKLYSETTVTESDSSDSSSGTTETVSWYLDGYSQELINSSRLGVVASAAANISASREVKERTAEDCGLDSPALKVEVVPKEGEGYTILLGAESPDKSGYYLKLSNSDKIYVVGSDVYASFEFVALDMANTDSIPAFTVTDDMTDYKDDSGMLLKFDKMTVSGKNFPQPVIIEANTDEKLADYAAFVVTSPTRRIAENVDSLLAMFQSGVASSGAYSFDTSASSLAKFGLNNPDLSITVEVMGKKQSYKFSLQEDGSYAAWSDGVKLIKKVDASSLSFADYTTKDFYSSWVALISIDDLNGFTFTTGGKTHSFGIAPQTDEEADTDYIITYDGKTIDTESFQGFYEECISVSCTDYTVESVSGTPEYEMSFIYKDTSLGKYEVKFYKASETRYQYTVNGVSLGKVNAATMKKLASSLETLVKK